MTPKFVFGKEKNDWIKRPLLSNIEKILDYRGRTPKKLGLSWSDTGILALSALNVKNGYIDFNADANYGDQELYNRWMGDNNLHKGQVVFTTEAPMGNVAQIPNDALYILSQRTIAFEVKHHLIREDFLATLLRSPKIFNELTSLSSGGTAKGVSQKSLSNLNISVPASLDEQSAIGSLFRTLDDLLVSYKDNLANYQSLKATMLSKMFPKVGQTVPEIRLDGFDGEWECVKMEDIFQIIDGDRGKSYPGESDFSSFGHTLFLDTGNVKKTGLDFSTTKFISEEKDKELRNGKLILGDFILTSRGTLGNVAYYDENIKKRYSSVRINSAMLILRPLLGDKISHEYILAILRGNLISDFMKVNQVGSAQPHITKKEFSKIKVQVPSNIREQQAIGTYFTNLDNLISAHQEKITQLETLKKKLLQDMFI
ncbi:MAG: restriction endonuclease subunit S [Streptococcus thermophilus]